MKHGTERDDWTTRQDNGYLGYSFKVAMIPMLQVCHALNLRQTNILILPLIRQHQLEYAHIGLIIMNWEPLQLARQNRKKTIMIRGIYQR